MIVKTKDRCVARTPLEVAGDRAELRMAYYLDRAFAAATDALVLNDIRIPLGRTAHGADDAVQIDHLVIHLHGMILIESKSVTSAVRINTHGEWERLWDRAWKGMGSPVLQAERQRDALRGLLQENRAELRQKYLLGMMQGGFKYCPIDIFVAISDDGRFAEGSVRPEGVMKAEAVADRVREIVSKHRAGEGVIGMLRTAKTHDGDYTFTDDEIQRVCMFLVHRHTPIRPAEAAHGIGASEGPARVATAPRASPSEGAQREKVERAARDGGTGAATISGVVCKHCGGREGTALWGRKAYYLKCGACGKGTDLPTVCDGCGRVTKIRKDGPRFWRECGAEAGGCGRRVQVWENA